MIDVRDTETMRRSFRTRRMLPGGFPGLHSGLVCDAPSAPLTDGVGSVLDREVYFPTRAWSSKTGLGHGIGNGSTLRQNEIETDKKTFGEAFGEARAETVESIFPSPTGRLRGQRTRLQKNRGARATTLEPQIRNDYAGKFTSRRGLGLFFAKYSEGIALGLGRKTVKSPVGA